MILEQVKILAAKIRMWSEKKYKFSPRQGSEKMSLRGNSREVRRFLVSGVRFQVSGKEDAKS
jgi:hypothetical protein